MENNNINNSTRLYRVQAEKYHKCPLVPTAMRHNNISWLRTNPAYAQLITAYSDFEIKAVTKWYNDIRCTRDINPFEAYFLSLVNLCITIKHNPLLKKFCKAPFFTDTEHDVGTLCCDDVTTIKRCYNYAKALFVSPDTQNAAPFYHDIIKEELSLFQHLNHVFNKIGQGCLFPTMMLDWTDDLETAKKFADDEYREIFSIDMMKCFDFFRFGIKLKLDNSRSLLSQVIEAQNVLISGAQINSQQKNTETNFMGLYAYRMNGCNNQLMIDQSGVTIFWPWSFTPDELKRQNDIYKGFGYEIDFRQEDK
ncbi:MAG: hypothetical protein LBD18_04435 [Treponema sp.]|nr:hypothetical protein [Treponema sp.]